MIPVHLVALTPRSVALRLHRAGARYRLDPPAAWRLVTDEDVREGRTETVVMALHDLEPGRVHVFEAEGFARFSFETPPCSGLLDIRGFGARPESDDNAPAIHAAIAAVPPGGTLVIPEGRWQTTPLFLKSGMCLQIASGAELAATSDRSAWPILPARGGDGGCLGTWEGRAEPCHAALLTAIGVRDLSISGPGTLDGGGARGDWWAWPKEMRNGARRARAIHLIDSARLALLGFTVRNSPSWTVHPQGCTDLTAAALRIEAPHDSPNTDGFNPESSERVTIEGVWFSVGDDCIAIKSGKRAPHDEALPRPTRDVTVRHCLMERGHGGVVIGSEMSGGVHGVRVAHCEMEGTDRGLRIKTRRGRGGRVSDISMEHVTMDGVLTAFSANAFYHCDADGHDAWVQSRKPAEVDASTPRIDGIRVTDVRVSRLAHALGVFLGLPEAPITGITIDGIDLGPFDPDAEAAPPLMADGVRSMRHETIAVEWAEITGDRPDLLSGRPISITD